MKDRIIDFFMYGMAIITCITLPAALVGLTLRIWGVLP